MGRCGCAGRSRNRRRSARLRCTLGTRNGLPKRRAPQPRNYTPGTLALETVTRKGRTLYGPVPDHLRPEMPVIFGQICGSYCFTGYRDIPTCDLWSLLESADMEDARWVAVEIRAELMRRQGDYGERACNPHDRLV